MARRSVLVAGQAQWIADDDALPADLGWWAVLRVRVVDELTGEPPRVPLRFSAHPARCTPRIAADGLCGLVARPRDVGSLLVGHGALHATLEAEGYLPLELDQAIDTARRRLPLGAAAGTQVLQLTLPADAAPDQFRPGRGVMIERALPGEAEQFTRQADPAAPPPPGEVPIDDAVMPARPANHRVSGVPMVLPEQGLHRAEPVLIRGSARRQAAVGAAPVSAPAARIGIAGLWWTQAEVAAHSAPPHAPRLVAFAAPLRSGHAAGAPLEQLTLAPDGVARALRAAAAAGASSLRLHPWNGLDPTGGDVLQIEADGHHESELVVTAGFDVPPAPLSAAELRLRTPLAFTHARAAPVVRATAAALPAGALDREAMAGDRVLFPTSVAALAAQDVLRIGAGAQAELRFVRVWPRWDGAAFHHLVPLDAHGRFALPPVARVAQMQFFVQHAGHPAQLPIDFSPQYGSEHNTLRVLFMP